MNTHAKPAAVREVVATTPGVPATDGDGVRMTRVIGSPELNMLDPFLLLDAFESDQPQDYIGGFPSHPHRGFETVTYLLAGRMRHKDNAGNEGVIEPGGVQWMTAGKGIPPAQTPLEVRENGTEVRVIAGTTSEGTSGVVKNEFVYPTYLDVSLPAGQSFTQAVNASDNTFLFVIDGEVESGMQGTTLGRRMLGILGEGDSVTVKTRAGARFLLVSAQPLNEPVARGGPFVMNTKEEIMQAFDDYRHNRF